MGTHPERRPAVHALIIGVLALGNTGTCPPIAVLSGDATLVEAVRVELSDRGIVETPLPSCDAVGVRLVSRAGDVVVEVERIDGPAISRIAGDAKSAATIIESWVRSDITAPLLERERPAEDRAPFRAPETPGAPPAEPARISREPRPFALNAGGIFGVGEDGSTWWGADVRGCIRLWMFCLGARFQYSADLELRGDALRLDGGRYVYDFGVTADAPIVVGSFEIIPGGGLGLGILHADVDIREDVEVRTEASFLRARAQLGGTWRFADHFSARIDLALDYVPFARRTLYERAGGDEFALPGEPMFSGWVRAGLEAGGL